MVSLDELFGETNVMLAMGKTKIVNRSTKFLLHRGYDPQEPSDICMCEHEIWDLVFALRYYLFHSYCRGHASGSWGIDSIQSRQTNANDRLIDLYYESNESKRRARIFRPLLLCYVLSRRIIYAAVAVYVSMHM